MSNFLDTVLNFFLKLARPDPSTPQPGPGWEQELVHALCFGGPARGRVFILIRDGGDRFCFVRTKPTVTTAPERGLPVLERTIYILKDWGVLLYSHIEKG